MSTAERVPWDSPVVRVVLLSTALAPLGVPLVAPALPAFREALSLTDAEASLLVSAYFVAGIVLSPFLGAFADRYGRRRLLVVALVVFSLTGASIALAPPYGVVVGVRVVQGTAAAGLFVATVTLVGDAFDGVQRNAVLGVNAAVLGAGAAAYPILGGALAGVSWRAPFVAYLLALPAAVVASRVLPAETRRTARPGYLSAMARVATSAGALGYYAATLLTELLLFGAILTALPFLLVREYGASPLGIGLVITAAEVVAAGAAASNGWLARRAGDAAIVRAGIATYAVGLLAVPFATSVVGVAAGAAVVGAGVGFVLPSVDAGLSARVPGDLRAGALSLRNSVTFLGRAAGPLLFAYLAADTGYEPLLTAAGVAALAAVALATVGSRLRARP
ncbi:MFS transporter [Halobacterium litoreum]|uniref:MFS transporter n=1 Tax=Halobacterium litoreum TaxID=2039234 RepID=A0ABD5NI46_9EURY|nr:MFS transporter [Halobacterium litoreum]UHH12282.1 MFS transporter [Halobacterium litoreum]